MARIFLTGGTGFIGSHFINAAHRAGHEVVALRRPGSRPRVPLEQEPAWVDGTLDGDHATAMDGCTVFVHLASHTPNPPYDTLVNCLFWNVQCSLNLTDQARRAGIHNFLVAGSCFEYGFAASRYQQIPADAPLEPVTSYPASKAAASLAFIGFAIQHMLKLRIFRIFQVYGEGELQSRLWPALRAAAFTGRDFPMTYGEQVRDFINVSAVADAFVEGLDFRGVDEARPVIRNIGSGQPRTLLEFADEWWRRWRAAGQLLPGAVPYRSHELMCLVPSLDEKIIQLNPAGVNDA